MTKKKWIGSLLNFLVPGLGFAYSRNIKKGILSYFLFFIVVLSVRFTAYNFTLFISSVTLIVGYYLYLIICGYRDVEKDKVYEPLKFDKWYPYVLILCLHWLFAGTIRGRTLDKLTPINFASIPTPAMDPALLVGDILAYKKTKSVERNDVIVFWYPEDINTMYVKRCIGLPGDSLQIKQSKVLVNGTPAAEIPLKFMYIVTTDSSGINPGFLEKNGIGEMEYYRSSSDSYQFFLTTSQADEFKKLPVVTNVEAHHAIEGVSEEWIYPTSGNRDWNVDFYGPIYIPKKGDKIDLTDKNLDMYLKCIQFENELAVRDSSGLKINGQLMTTYEFKENYFFMMGDNRHNSADSRFWGLLPQELVIGKVLYTYWGKTSERIGKKIL